MDLLVLRELMGHPSPETTAGYVNPLAADTSGRVRRRQGGEVAMSVANIARAVALWVPKLSHHHSPATSLTINSCVRC
jgi:hypothetical protein